LSFISARHGMVWGVMLFIIRRYMNGDTSWWCGVPAKMKWKYIVYPLAFWPKWTTLDDVVQRRPLWVFPCRQISVSLTEILDRYFDSSCWGVYVRTCVYYDFWYFLGFKVIVVSGMCAPRRLTLIHQVASTILFNKRRKSIQR
jgi:hypothetical protein